LKRTKRRYLALRVECAVLPGEREFMDVLWGSVAKLYGEVGASQTALSLIHLDVERKVAVVRASLVTLDSVRASFASIVCLGDKPGAVHVLAVSGTIKALAAKF
jgi:RNase P/RNase MRP subunit POP5